MRTAIMIASFNISESVLYLAKSDGFTVPPTDEIQFLVFLTVVMMFMDIVDFFRGGK